MPTPLASRLQRTGDTYLVEDTDIHGGYRSVADLAERNAIPLSARRVGMTVYCIADKTEYQLIGTVSNGAWTIRPLFSGKLHGVATLIVTGPLQQFDPYTFEAYAAQQIVLWFNLLPSANRVLNTPVAYFKILCAVGAPSVTVGKTLPANTTYYGDATFIYDAAASSSAVTLNATMLVGISKSLIPLGDAVIAAMDEYAVRKAGE